MRILITGGRGYVGRTLTRLLMQDHSVCVVDNHRYGLSRFEAQELKHFQLKNIDIRDLQKLERVIQDFQPEVIIHLAAIHYIPECETQLNLTLSTNIEGTVNLLSLCPPDCRFVFASSGAIYSPQDTPHNEASSPTEPMDVYGFTKLQGEHYVKYFAKRRGFAAVIVRLFNVAGPGETNPHLLPEIFAQLKSSQRTIKLGNLSPKRDYIDVRDAARGFWAAASRGNVPPKSVTTVNLGTMKQYSVVELLDRIKVISGIEFEIEQDVQRLRKVDRPYLFADISQIEALFGWKPKFNINDTIKAMIHEPDLPVHLVKKYSLLTVAPLKSELYAS
ncbi:epimerase [Pleurocapsa sp. CCALA 161]|uniref:NAD-dependent epimerase/dehydratase family protein n=1 Tax=Pleurocapsa sp. CCALA 161 TaxID=2107688 RepID=UPI000D0639F2|nr:NAD(P)-dependent oxidoreductase [Pleurocapsa sp. CCALA 161]PSB08079.1 epimerase [Pleurocapsa sp. CCALA 161]